MKEWKEHSFTFCKLILYTTPYQEFLFFAAILPLLQDSLIINGLQVAAMLQQWQQIAILTQN